MLDFGLPVDYGTDFWVFGLRYGWTTWVSLMVALLHLSEKDDRRTGCHAELGSRPVNDADLSGFWAFMRRISCINEMDVLVPAPKFAMSVNVTTVEWELLR